MTHMFLALAGLASAVALSLWFSLREVADFDLSVLPVSCSQRVRWCQLNCRGVYQTCACLAAIGAALALPGLRG